jgi:hypothetical protein
MSYEHLKFWVYFELNFELGRKEGRLKYNFVCSLLLGESLQVDWIESERAQEELQFGT